jgi:thiamine-phosphate pyrophosphorylase
MFTLPRLYPITDARISRLTHAEQALRLIAGGAELVQLREKQAPAREFYEAARTAVEAAKPTKTPVIINDRVDIALLLGATGVHLGQNDLPPPAARKIMGSNAIIGYSTHNLDQARRAADLPIDYLAIGPIFATSSKENPDPVVGLEGLRRVRAAVPNLPLVAIGGITRENARSVIDAGADSVAVISAVLADPERTAETTRELIELLS